VGIAYFQGLGGEKADDYLKACVALKKPLSVQQDADGLDRFAKSVRATNCQTALRFAADIESQPTVSRRPSQIRLWELTPLRHASGSVAEKVQARILALINSINAQHFFQPSKALIPCG